MPFELIRWTLADKYKWTLPEVDSLSMGDLAEWFQVEDGIKQAGAPRPEADTKPLGRRKRR